MKKTKEHIEEEESEKPGLKLNIQKTKIMASGLITSWQMEEGKMEAGTDFLFLGSKIIADGDCSHEIDTCSLEEKAMTNLDSILKSRKKKKKNPKQKTQSKAETSFC